MACAANVNKVNVVKKTLPKFLYFHKNITMKVDTMNMWVSTAKNHDWNMHKLSVFR